MWRYERSDSTTASPEAVWSVLRDIDKWPEWDHAIEAVDFKEFSVGAKGRLKQKRGWFDLEITDIEENAYFADSSKLPLGLKVLGSVRMRPEQSTAGNGDRTKVTFTITVKGSPLTFIFQRLIGKKIAATTPAALNNLIKVAEQRQAESA